MADLPHFVLPFHFAYGAAAVVEQDSTDDVMVSTLAVLLCPLGYRSELPEFGMEDPTFAQGLPDTEAIARTLAEWEPRADALFTTERDRLDQLIAYVTVALGTRSTD